MEGMIFIGWLGVVSMNNASIPSLLCIRGRSLVIWLLVLRFSLPLATGLEFILSCVARFMYFKAISCPDHLYFMAMQSNFWSKG